MLLLMVLIAQAISWFLNFNENPEWVADNPQIDRLAKIFIFISVAWWLAGSSRKVIFIWFFALLGCISGTFFKSDGVAELLLGLQGVRVHLGVRNWQHSAMLLGVCVIGLSVFFPRVLSSKKFRILKISLWSILFFYSLLGLYVTQTRAVLIGLLLGFLTFVIIFLFSKSYSGAIFNSRINKVAVVSFGVFVFCLIFYFSVGERVINEIGLVYPRISNMQLPLPDTSFGVRFNTWIASFSWIAEKPIFGWGGEGRGLVIDYTPWLSDWTKENIGHLHNYILEVLVAYGVFGLSLIVMLYGWIFFTIYHSWKYGYIRGDVAAFGVVFSVYWVFVNQFESYLSFWTGVYVHNIIFGGFVSLYWSGRLKNGER
ncbi:O-antigen ligase family protein [Halomonas sp. EF61]|uniref:O-antigen ligase family protein n=1 Tax=Halomonas sp. EF61 TaxID=2950869 RepID=UPI0032DE34FF